MEKKKKNDIVHVVQANAAFIGIVLPFEGGGARCRTCCVVYICLLSNQKFETKVSTWSLT
jgi:hypothetical protein